MSDVYTNFIIAQHFAKLAFQYLDDACDAQLDAAGIEHEIYPKMTLAMASIKDALDNLGEVRILLEKEQNDG